MSQSSRNKPDFEAVSFQYITTALVGLLLLVCGSVGYGLTLMSHRPLDVFSTSLLLVAFGGMALIIYGLCRYGLARHVWRHQQQALEHPSAPHLKNSPYPAIDPTTSLIIRVPYPYSHTWWLFMVLDFLILSICLYFGIAWLSRGESYDTLMDKLLQEEVIAWTVLVVVTATPILLTLWRRRFRLRHVNELTMGQELVFDKNGLRLAATLLPNRIQKAMLHSHVPALFIPWKNIRAWSVEEDHEFRGLGHKLFVTPVPTEHLINTDALKFPAATVLTIPPAYIRGVETEVIKLVESYGPGLTDKLLEDHPVHLF